MPKFRFSLSFPLFEGILSSRTLQSVADRILVQDEIRYSYLFNRKAPPVHVFIFCINSTRTRTSREYLFSQNPQQKNNSFSIAQIYIYPVYILLLNFLPHVRFLLTFSYIYLCVCFMLLLGKCDARARKRYYYFYYYMTGMQCFSLH